MTHYFDKKFKIYKIEDGTREKILLYHTNFKKHIKVKHPEINLKKIKEILLDPDFIYKYSRNSKKKYYEKRYNDGNYRVVVDKNNKNNDYQVVTAYKIDNVEKFTAKHSHCIYDKEYNIAYEQNKLEIEQDKFYYEAFGVFE